MKLITAGNRPASVWYRGAEIMVHVHDNWYIQKCRYYLAEMKATHPDRGTNRWGRTLTGPSFVTANNALLKFKREQAYWYKQFKLSPPKVSKSGATRSFRPTGCKARVATSK